MDIKRFDSVKNAEAGMELKLLDPETRADTGASLVLYGADSSIHKAMDKEIAARTKARGRAPSTDEIAEEVLERLARMTKGWKGLEDGGKAIPFSVEKAKELYKAYPELADRAAAFIFNRANFFDKASGS